MAAYVYHYFEDILGPDPLNNRRKPILFSIASLRRFRSDAKVYVVDSSRCKQDWTPYQREMDFEVLKACRSVAPIGYPLADGRGMEKLWTFTEHEDIADDVLVSVSNNLIFLADPEPLDDGLIDVLIGGDREGCFCFRRSSHKSRWMMQQWQAACLHFLEGGRFQRDVFVFNRGRQGDEHIIMAYMMSQQLADWWSPPRHGESVPFFMLTDIGSTLELKSVCLNEAFVGFDKVGVILAFKELRESVVRSSWMNRFAEESKFSLADMETNLEGIRRGLRMEGTGFFVRHDGKPLYDPSIRQVQKSGRPL